MKKRLLSALAALLIATTALAANTTHYNWALPTVGASQNTWGSTLNTLFNSLDTNLWTVAGGTSVSVNAPSASATNITLTNPLASTQNISFSASSQQLILPVMNASQSMVPGGVLTITNVGANAFAVMAQDDSTTIISSLPAGYTAFVKLLTNSTANGTFQFTMDAANTNTAPYSVSLGGTGNTSLLAHGVLVGEGTSAITAISVGTSGYVLTGNGSADPSFQPPIAGVPTGASIIWTTTSCPAGYTYENGQAISRTTFSALFGVIGTTFGIGNGSTTFNVPDTRGYFIRGWADNGSIDPGRTFGTTQSDAIASHTVTSVVNDPGHSHPVPLVSWAAHAGTGGASDTPLTGSGATTNTAFTGITVTSTYTGAAETRPVNLALVFCIKN